MFKELCSTAVSTSARWDGVI